MSTFLGFAEPGIFFPKLLHNFSLTKMGACYATTLVLYSLLISPALLDGLAIILLLLLLTPFGFVFGKLEHKNPFVWVLLVLMGQIGGILDVLADIIQLAKLVPYTFGFGPFPEDEEKATEEQEQLVMARFVITLLAFIPSLMVLRFLLVSAPKIIETVSGVLKSDEKMPTVPPGPAIAILIVMGALLWKFLMVGLRVYLLFVVLIALVKHQHITDLIKVKLHWLEIILFCDLAFSGIPLGIITVMELRLDDRELGEEQIFEIVKLAALVVDMIGAAYLVWFVVGGLGGRHVHHEGKYNIQNVEQNQPLLDD